MRTKHCKSCYLLDDGVLLFGYKDKYGFHPQTKRAGFSLQKVRKREKNKILFKSVKDAFDIVGTIPVIGGIEVLGVDIGMYRVKYAGLNVCGEFLTENLSYDECIDKSMRAMLKQRGYSDISELKVKLITSLPDGSFIGRKDIDIVFLEV